MQQLYKSQINSDFIVENKAANNSTFVNYTMIRRRVEVNTCLNDIILAIVQEHELEQAICRGHISNRNKKRTDHDIYEVLNLF